ncbi:MAG: hypothetical protein AVDCRST_MAG80-651 [uncultured Rubrobacteraceae bacterium]|uniref:Peptide zinc metalloprotease protein n=1 Tax=uncultured Rubrobacteraceae bacterium TaxID=349277 RepID=A0A6J4QA72_9ACTN|nr:MAG: hypothetical protein AVDCRST_MAG80-651 [uncultured Rubrobacteraceae bacterium]
MPRLAEGLELIGEYEGSGFKETPYLARRVDGQVLQLTRLLYLVAAAVDGERDFDRIAEEVTGKFGRTVSAENIEFLVKKKLRPLGVLAAADGTSPRLKKAAPMLSLSFRTKLVPERVVHAITTFFYPLFHWPVVVLVLGGLTALDAWLFFVHGVAQSAREIAYQPALFLMVFGLVVLSAAFHECGHATACRYGGAKPGVLGAGLYIVYPAFFSDVTDVYRLGKWGRVRTDLGGIYFNMIFSLLTAGAYFLTGFEPLLAIIVLQHLEMLHQLLPFLRLDGYYVVSDITGVPDLFARIKPILRSVLAPWREPDAAVTALKPWVRVVVTLWVLSVVPILLYLLATIFVAVPRLLATAWDSLLVQYDNATSALGEGDLLATAAGAIQMIFLVLPLAGLTYTFGLLGKRLGVAAWTRTEGKPVLRTGLASATLVSFGLLTFAWWPSEDHQPIQPGERGTVQDSLKAIEEQIPAPIRPSLADDVQENLEAVDDTVRASLEPTEEYVPAVSRLSFAPEPREEEPDDGPATSEQPGSPTGTDASEPARTPDEPAQSAAPSGDPDEPAPAGEEQPSSAQQIEQDAGAQPSSQPPDDPDYAAPAPALPEPKVAPALPEPEVAPAPLELEESEPSPDSSGYYDRGSSDYGSSDDDSGYDRGGDDGSDDGAGSGYDRDDDRDDDGYYDGYGR